MKPFSLFLIAFFTLTLSSALAQSHELIIVSGGPAIRYFEKGKAVSHDVYWGNFIRTALIKYHQLQAALQPGDEITWLVYRPSYRVRSEEADADLLAEIVADATKDNIHLLWFDNANQLINYFNDGKDRKLEPISSFDYFGHSNGACFLFDYSNQVDGLSINFLHIQDLTKIHKGIFSPHAVIKSWGCHSGELFSKAWKDRFGIPMIGAVGKTDYSFGTLPVISTKNGHWNE